MRGWGLIVLLASPACAPAGGGGSGGGGSTGGGSAGGSSAMGGGGSTGGAAGGGSAMGGGGSTGGGSATGGGSVGVCSGGTRLVSLDNNRYALHLALTPADLYWSNSIGIQRRPFDGGAIETIDP